MDQCYKNPMSTDMAYLQYEFSSGITSTPWFSEWTVNSMREAINQHDAGFFYASSMAATHTWRLAPVLGALYQRIGPPLGIERAVHGAKRWNGKGLSEVVRSETEDIFSQNQAFHIGFLGSLFARIAMMGFAVIQHPWCPSEDGSLLIPKLTTWPAAATTWDSCKRRYIAHTLDGPVDIVDGDGHWTVIAPWGDESEPSHLMGAIRAIGMVAIKGGMAERDEAEYSAIHGLSKPIGYMPPNVTAKGDDGEGVAAARDFAAAVKGLLRPRSGGTFPHESKVELLEAKGQSHGIFEQIAKRVGSYVAMALVGQDATLGKGSGSSVYASPMFAGVKFSLTRAETRAAGVALSRGVARPYAALNYGAPELAARLEWLLPDLEADARTRAYGKRLALFLTNCSAARAAGFEVDQEEADDMAQRHGVVAPNLRKDLPPAPPSQVVPPPPAAPAPDA
ncbi:phage portal protein family protein [Sorangium sp. So ce1000]|uniref:phage portal protein family protein n=1 Tax=Sorangium sp. So ce1000 TaxID=3133325 RepID=UPI003F61E623